MSPTAGTRPQSEQGSLIAAVSVSGKSSSILDTPIRGPAWTLSAVLGRDWIAAANASGTGSGAGGAGDGGCKSTFACSGHRKHN